MRKPVIRQIVFCFLSGIFSLNITAQPRPHIFILLADDLGYGDLGYTGHPIIKTPHIDTLAAHARQLTFYAGGAICSPSRVALMTGRVPQAVGVAHNIPVGSQDPNIYTLKSTEVTLPQTLANAGYRCYHAGKWHLTPIRSNSITKALGFTDSQSGSINGNNNAWSVVATAKNQLAQSLQEHPNEPVFQYICFNEPHDPLTARLQPNISIIDELGYNTLTDFPICLYDTPPFNTIQPGYIDSVKLFCGTVSNLDRAIGNFLGYLDSLGIRDSSIIMFLSDNGPATFSYGTAGCELAGTKYKIQNGGLRVPALVQWKGRWDDGTEACGPSGMIDIMPTLCQIAGAPMINRGQLHGQNVENIWDCTEVHRKQPLYWFYIAARRRNIFSGMLDNRFYHQALIDSTGRYKLVRSLECWSDSQAISLPLYNRFGALGIQSDAVAVYDLLNDPLEKNNIASTQPDIAQALINKANALDKPIRRQAPIYYFEPNGHVLGQICVPTPLQADTTTITCPEWPVILESSSPMPELNELVGFQSNNNACSLWQTPAAGTFGLPPFADVHIMCHDNHTGHCRVYFDYITDSTDNTNFDFELAPNPAQTFFYIRTAKLETLHLEIFSNTGFRIYENLTCKPFHNVDVAQWPAGTYVVRAQTKNKEAATKKLIIVR
jgi:arylsulfatase A